MMLKHGVSITRPGERNGTCPLAEWYAKVADWFRGRVWIVYSYAYTPFRLADVVGEAAYERLLVPGIPADKRWSELFVYSAAVMDRYVKYWYCDWLKMCGLPRHLLRAFFDHLSVIPADDYAALEHWLLKRGDPLIVNLDGAEWRCYSHDADDIREMLSHNPKLCIRSVTLRFEDDWAW